ncbi:MAG: TonB-dependent receptor, partial [Bacteroidales bacterium]|nr:TonB-dependent receptor [Bacteroidales bacterium]
TGLPFLIPVLSSYDVTSFGVETSWKSRNLNITAKLQSNDYKGAGDAEVYMLPKMEISSSVAYDIKKRFFVGADFHYESEKNSWHGGKVPDYIDLSATATYVVNRHLSAYIKGGNLLNRHNFRYFEIPEIPLNIGGGVSVKF